MVALATPVRLIASHKAIGTGSVFAGAFGGFDLIGPLGTLIGAVFAGIGCYLMWSGGRRAERRERAKDEKEHADEVQGAYERGRKSMRDEIELWVSLGRVTPPPEAAKDGDVDA